MLKLVKKYCLLLVPAIIVVVLDQITKIWVRSNLRLGETWMPWEWLAPYARIVYWNNTGVAFGMFQGQGGLFAILAVIIALAIIYYFPRIDAKDVPLRLALGLQLGGAIGNLIDRIQFQGQVTDFISLGSFAVFNVADGSITVGVGIMILGVWLEERRAKREKFAQESTAKSDSLDRQ